MSHSLLLRELFGSLYRHTGPDAYTEVLVPWAAARGEWLRDLLAPLRTYGDWRRERYEFGDLLEQAYALGRVNDVLLLGFQPPLPANVALPFAHHLHLDTEWPEVTADEYLAFFTGLGMAVVHETAFDPFFHEIVAVEQSDTSDDPIEIVDTVWPGLIWGDMLFSRSGVRVRAGANQAVAGYADQSTLHEVFLRRHRPTSDRSLAGGSNSQWKTDFRRDYLTSDGYHFNVDGKDDADQSGAAAQLTVDQRHDLLRHRCLLRPIAAVEGEPYPGNYALSVLHDADGRHPA